MQKRFQNTCYLFFVLLFGGISAGAQSSAYTVETVPNPKDTGNGYVSDPDNIISPSDEAYLNTLLGKMEEATTAQMAIVIVQSIGMENPKDFSTALFNRWGIGQADVNNGVLIFTVMDQRRTEFETGYGMEGVLPDVICYRIGMQELVPEFREGRYGKGLIAAAEKINEVLTDPAAMEEIQSSGRGRPMGSSNNGGIGWGIYGLLALVVNVYLLSRIVTILRSKEDLYDKYLDLKKVNFWLYFVLFPIPYLLIYWFIKNRLKKLRYTPRFSRQTGAPLRLLSEEEEDVYLEKGQVTEEEIGSADYDVWKADEEDEILILRYKKAFSQYKNCPKCNYATYYQASSKVVRHPTYTSTGKKEIIHRCKNCHYEKQTFKIIPKKVQSSSSSGGGSWSGGGGGGGSWGGGSSGGGGGGVSW